MLLFLNDKGVVRSRAMHEGCLSFSMYKEQMYFIGNDSTLRKWNVDNGSVDRVFEFGRCRFVEGGNNELVVVGTDNKVWSLDGSHSRLISFPDDIKIDLVSCGVKHTLALDSQGYLYSWGTGTNGRLGHGTLESEPAPKLLDNLVSAKVRIICLSTGAHHSLILSSDCRVFSFGSGQFGKLGHGSKSNEYSPREIDFFNISDDECSIMHQPVVRVSCGLHHSVLLTGAGYVLAFGLNNMGQLGNSNESENSTPTLITNLSSRGVFVADVACGDFATVCITNRGKPLFFGKSPGFNTQGSLHNVGDPYSLNNISNKLEIVKSNRFSFLFQTNDSSQDMKLLSYTSNILNGTTASYEFLSAVMPSTNFPVNDTLLSKSRVSISWKERKCCEYHNRFGQKPLSVQMLGYLHSSLEPELCV